MFERYTEKARRVIFFARTEASEFGSPSIETEHILLGLLHEDKALGHRFLLQSDSYEQILKQIESRSPKRQYIDTAVDMPLSSESKHILSHAVEEMRLAGQAHISTEHLLAGVLRVEGCFAAMLLKERGVKLDDVRRAIKEMATSETAPPSIVQSDAPASGRGDSTVINFICNGEPLTNVVGPSSWVVPRVGEQITLLGQRGERHYRVITVNYRYFDLADAAVAGGPPNWPPNSSMLHSIRIDVEEA